MAARVKKGDTVEILWGDEKGERATVHAVMPAEGKVIVAGRNIIKKHQRPTGQVRTQAGIIEREAPMRLSKVAPVCRNCDRPTRVGFRMEDGRKVRVCKRCDEVMA
ncbi:MAG: 50S ribosomal protein L24 [Chloroflexi bacterium]|nr:50S ribosomal protein L24 [Chloroflexota bacterium]MBI3732560.1 50S ribosomal protein L24 [Chloroflexota bacterium]